MGKKKKRARFSARTIWAMFIGYMVIGAIVAIVYLGRKAPDPELIDATTAAGSNPWALFPVFVLLWPIFLAILILQSLA